MHEKRRWTKGTNVGRIHIKTVVHANPKIKIVGWIWGAYSTACETLCVLLADKNFIKKRYPNNISITVEAL